MVIGRRSSNERPTRCPKCGEAEIVRIAYGLPSPELVEEAQRGEVALGGCCIDDDSPEFRCKQCGHEWSRARAWDVSRREDGATEG
ncbi:MAG: hypothetical protein HZA52_15035 [Planctomycetes bacterium]|nr:hypothetical protein [Planctomycetota bacterium]